MKKNPTVLLDNMISALNDLPGLKEADTDSIVKGINIVATSLSDLNAYILSQSFQTEEDEIKFFKKTKPEFDGRMIFYLMLLKSSECSLDSSENNRLSYLKKIENFCQDPFWIYFKMGYTHFDQQYFLRKSQSNDVIYTEEQIHYDRNTNALMSAKAARIVAYDLFKEHKERTLLLPRSEALIRKENKNEPGLMWTASVADFVEFVYSAHERRLFGNGIKISTLTNLLSTYFGIKVTNVFKTWEDIRLRKKDKAPFMRSMVSCLERRIDHDNEFAP